MTVIARRVAARPVRTASQAWGIIVDMLFGEFEEALAECAEVSGVAAAIIAEEVPAEVPLVLIGAGPRVRVYCLYDEDAVEGDDVNETPLALDFEEKDWTLWLPCATEDLEWAQNALVISLAILEHGDVYKETMATLQP